MSDVLDLIYAADDRYLATWVEVESIPELIVPQSMPYTEAQTGRTHKAILAPKDYRGKSGNVDPMGGISQGQQVQVRCLDSTGWLAGMLGEGVSTYLTAACTRTDTTITVASTTGFAASGAAWLCSERFTYTGITATQFTGVTRKTHNTPGYACRCPALPDGTVPAYRVGTTPWFLEGRWIKIWGVPLSSTGAAMVDYADAQELWCGIVDGVPASVDGIKYDIVCSGLERQLNSPVPIATAKARLLQCENFRLTEEGQVGGLPAYYYSNEALAIVLGHQHGQVWIGSSNNKLRWTYTRYDTGTLDAQATVDITIPTGFYGVEITQTIAGLLNAALVTAGFDEFDLPTGSANGKAQIGIWPETAEVGPIAEADLRVESPGSDLTATLDLIPAGYGDARATLGWLSSDRPVLGSAAYSAGWIELWYGRPASACVPYSLTPDASSIPVIFPEGNDWPSSGYGTVNGELVSYASIADTGVKTAEGWTVYELTGCDRNVAGTSPQVLAGKWAVGSEDMVSVDVKPAAMLYGDTVFDAAARALTGIGEAGNGTYSAAAGAGLYAGLIDIAELTRLSTVPPLSGRRLQHIDESTSVGNWLQHNLAAEGYMLVPGFVGSAYRLTAKRMGTPAAGSVAYSLTADYQRPINVQSGLGRITNQLVIESVGGTGDVKGETTINDLPSQRTFKVTQSRKLSIGQPPNIATQAALAPIGERFFLLFGRPAVQVDAAFGPKARVIQPGDFVTMTLGKGSSATWLVLTASPCWVPGQEHQRLTLWQMPSVDAAWYAPSAKVASVSGNTLTIEATEYSAGQSAIAPWLANADVHYFYPGCAIKGWQRGAYTSADKAYIVSVDWDTNEIVVNDATGFAADDLLAYDDYTRCEADVQADFQFIAASGTTYHEWSD